MATVSGSLGHEERTANEPRENKLEPVVLSSIREVNSSVRLLRLKAFLPGQWVDTFIPGVAQAGGFTITSSPSEARPSSHSSAFVELAVQATRNPVSQWLWRPEKDILNAQLVVRVGGSFTWPPHGLDAGDIERLVLVAGGKILFLPRLMDLVAAVADPNVSLRLFLTGTGDDEFIDHGQLPNLTYGRRIGDKDLISALDGFQTSVFGSEHDRLKTVAYVCGPPRMTDEVVAFLSRQSGMTEDRVRCEKWW
ncbi:uncharacterized protein K489DRAFT_385937 [Dissoconium aciculare CBS 342.82]|uniref:FAD-binding FR-type domain-containing protein n=1 Tax=Dissoconium aciculare CBS 342.82 TaxID=1314786 RepID=A0A6J3MHW6_9PEZI|nr:uncharacterized protein K489DRAFT_385937 [Dissoconium aciculare CBS 342.82]KAF1827294.1 hypothetical protein K489DRAFT_385937 [Dissoconium aciculare CBS 342.82]